MIKLLEVKKTSGKEVLATLFADTKAEVTNGITGSSIPELANDTTLSAGSFAITGSFDVGIMNSSGTWTWK